MSAKNTRLIPAPTAQMSDQGKPLGVLQEASFHIRTFIRAVSEN
jgi:hypothetical protein